MNKKIREELEVMKHEVETFEMPVNEAEMYMTGYIEALRSFHVISNWQYLAAITKSVEEIERIGGEK